MIDSQPTTDEGEELETSGGSSESTPRRSFLKETLASAAIAGSSFSVLADQAMAQQSSTDTSSQSNTPRAESIGFSNDASPNTLRIEGLGGFAYYAFLTTGTVNPDGGITGEDTIDGATASGAVGGGTDSYTFEGDLQYLYVGDGARAFVNNQEVDPDGSESVVSIQGDGTYTSYSFSLTINDIITGTKGLTGEDSGGTGSASGATAGGTDTYTFTGTFSSFKKTGSAAVILNGQEVDPSLFPPFSGRSSTLRIQGSGGRTFYAFQASGNVSPDGGITSEDSINGTGASGAVGGGTDAYTFEGNLQYLYVGDGASVYLNNQKIDPDRYGSVVSIQGDGSPADYAFQLPPSGAITRTQGLTGEDSIITTRPPPGPNGGGEVAGGTDTYTFTDFFQNFKMIGDAAVILNGQKVDPLDL